MNGSRPNTFVQTKSAGISWAMFLIMYCHRIPVALIAKPNLAKNKIYLKQYISYKNPACSYRTLKKACEHGKNDVTLQPETGLFNNLKPKNYETRK